MEKKRKSLIVSAAAAVLTAGAVCFAAHFYRSAPREDISVGITQREVMLPEISAEGLKGRDSSSEREDTSSCTDESSVSDSIPDNDTAPVDSGSDASSADVPASFIVTGEDDTSSADDSKASVQTVQVPDEVTEPAKVTPDGRQADREYFTASIKDGETVSDSTYFFTVTHLADDLEVVRCDVEVNGSLMTGFAGRVRLREGANSLRVSCTYKDGENRIYRAFRDYTVYLSSPAAEIVTDLKDCDVYDPVFTFTASCEDGMEVWLNGRTVEGRDVFTVNLNDGENMIKLSSGDTVLDFSVTYIPVRELSLITDLSDITVYSDSITFSAKAVGGNSPKLIVLVNRKALRGESNYTAKLNEGDNEIRLRVRDGKDSFEQTFTVISLPPAAEERLPRFESISLTDGITVKGSAYTLTFRAVDCDGVRLYSDSAEVICGGTKVPRKWEDSTCTGYILSLRAGENAVTVKLKDRSGRISEFFYKINCDAVEKGTEVGRIAVSVKADAVGLGTLCEDDSFPVLEGENGFDTMLRFLEENGFEVSSRGSDSSRYLDRIRMQGRFADAALTEESRAYLAAAGVTPNNSSDADSLGEFDFAPGSGWLYSRNGRKPSYAMSSAVFADGERVTLAFSLDLGNDVGGE